MFTLKILCCLFNIFISEAFIITVNYWTLQYSDDYIFNQKVVCFFNNKCCGYIKKMNNNKDEKKYYMDTYFRVLNKNVYVINLSALSFVYTQDSCIFAKSQIKRFRDLKSM